MMQTEQRMIMICDGVKSKQEVLHETINEYRDVFMRTTQQIGVLADVRRSYPSVRA